MNTQGRKQERERGGGGRERERERERERGRANGMNIRLFILRSISRNLIPPRPAESLVPPGALLVARIAWLYLKFLTPLPAGLCVYPVSSPMNGERTVNRVKKARKELCLSMYIFHPRILNIPSTIDSYCPPLGGILTLQPRRAELIIFFRCSYLFIDAPICREQQNNTSNEKITRLSVCKSISERRERVSSSVNALSIRAIKFSLLLPWSRPGLSRFIFPLLIEYVAAFARDRYIGRSPTKLQPTSVSLGKTAVVASRDSSRVTRNDPARRLHRNLCKGYGKQGWPPRDGGCSR